MQSRNNAQAIGQPLSGPSAGLQAARREEHGSMIGGIPVSPAYSLPQRLPVSADRFIAYHRRHHAANDIRAIDEPWQGQLPGIVFLGGFASDMTGTKALALDAYCAATGRAYVRFDYGGHGDSTGNFTDGTIGSWRDDVLAVLDRLTQGPQILIGSSMGGWLMLLAALARPARIHALIGLAAAPDFTEELMWDTMDEAMRKRLMAAGRIEEPSAHGDQPYVITRELIEEGRRHLLLRGAITIDRPVRLIHGLADADVPFNVSLRLADRLAGSDVVVTLVKDADHRLARPRDIDRLIATVDELSS